MTGHHLKYDGATGHLLYRPSTGHLVYGCLWTATADLIVGAATFSGTATFEELIASTADLIAPPATLTAEGTSGTPNYDSSADLIVGATTLSGTATRTASTYTASVDVTAGAATLAGEATHTAPTYTGTMDVTAGATTLTGIATFADVGFATAVLFVGPTTFEGTAEQQGPSSEGTADLTVGATTLSASGTHVPGTYTATGDCTAGAATLSGSASHEAKEYTATSTVTVGAATLSASGTHQADTYRAIGNLVLGRIVLFDAEGTFTEPPASNATASLTVGHATIAALGTHLARRYSGIGNLVLGRIVLFDAEGTSTDPPPPTATATLTVGHATFSGSGTHLARTYGGLATLNVGHATFSASGSHLPRTYHGIGTLVVRAATFSGSAQHVEPVTDWSLDWTGGIGQFGGGNQPPYEATFVTDVGIAEQDVIVAVTATAATGYDITGPHIQQAGVVSQSTTLRVSGRDAADGFGGHHLIVCEHVITSGGTTGLPTYNFSSVDPASDLGETVLFRMRRGTTTFVSKSADVDGSPSATPGAPASITVNYPTGIQEGDLLVICLTYESDGDQYLPAATGFTGVNDELSSFGVLISLARSINSCILVRTATGFESGSVTVNAVGPGEAGFTWYGCQATMLCYR